MHKPRGVPAADWRLLINLAEEFRDARAAHRAGDETAGDLDEMGRDFAATFVRLVLPPEPRPLIDVLDDQDQE